MEFFVGLVIGIILGVSGAGGVVAIPLIVILLNIPLSQAMGMALGVVMLSSCMGLYAQRRYVLVVPAIILGSTGALTAPLGRAIAVSIDEFHLLVCFLVVSLFISGAMWVKSDQPDQNHILIEVPSLKDFISIDTRIDKKTGSHKTRPAKIMGSVLFTLRSNWRVMNSMLLFGLFIGCASGLLGIGGGVFIIPFLRYFLHADMKTSLATSLMVIVLVSASGFFTSLIVYEHIDFFMLVKIASSAMIGIVLGYKIAMYCPEKVLQKVFSISLVFVSFLIFSNHI